MDLGRLSRRYLLVSFLACLWIAVLDALPTEGPHSADQEAQLRPHWQYPQDSNTTLGNSTTLWAVLCVYPVSGIYTRMQRILLYVATAFVFVLRSYDWLIAVGMTFVLTYASAACIHAFLLSTLNGIGPDLDVLAIQGIIVSTTIAICCYSTSSQRISEYAIAPLFYMWYSAMLVTFITTLYSTKGIWGNWGNLATFVVPAGCSADGECTPGACSNATSHGLFRSEMDQLVPIALEQWMYYNASNASNWGWGGYFPSEHCLNCDGLSYSNDSPIDESGDFTPSHILHIGIFSLIAVLVISRLVVSPLLFKSSESRNVAFIQFLMEFKTSGNPFNRGAWLSVLVFHTPFSKAPVRKAMKTILFYDLSTASEVEPRHIYVAKLLASCYFVCSWSARIIFFMLPVATMILSELTLNRLPESEAPRLVGQWAPFVYVGLAFLASLVLKFLNYRRVGVHEQRPIIYLSHPDSTESFKSPLRLHLSPYLIGKEFKTWWNDPVNVAKQDYEDMRSRLRFELMAARRGAAKRGNELSCVDDEEAGKPANAEPVERLEFNEIWERLSASVSESQNHRKWSTQIPSTFAICRGRNQGNSLADTGWITATYEEEEYEPISSVRRSIPSSESTRAKNQKSKIQNLSCPHYQYFITIIFIIIIIIIIMKCTS